MRYAIGVIGVEFAGVFNNAMMPSLVPPERIGRLSGTGWAIGYVGGLLSLIIVLGFLAGNPQTGKTLLGMTPLFGLDPGAREGDRAVGPLTCAVVRRVHPAAVFVYAGPAAAMPLAPPCAWPRELADTLRKLPQHRNVAVFLLAQMICADALLALFAFGGIYAAGTFGWSTIQIGVFGILLHITATIGAYARRQARRSHRAEARDARQPVDPAASRPSRSSRPAATTSCSSFRSRRLWRARDCLRRRREILIAIGLFIGLAAGPVQAAARTLLVRLAPADEITQFFGLFALSGKVTSFARTVAGRDRDHGVREPARRHGGAGGVLCGGRGVDWRR